MTLEVGDGVKLDVGALVWAWFREEMDDDDLLNELMDACRALTCDCGAEAEPPYESHDPDCALNRVTRR